MYFSQDIEKAIEGAGQCVRVISDEQVFIGYGVLSGVVGTDGGFVGHTGNVVGQQDEKNRLLICETALAFHIRRGDEIYVGGEKLIAVAVEIVHIKDEASYARVSARKGE